MRAIRRIRWSRGAAPLNNTHVIQYYASPTSPIYPSYVHVTCPPLPFFSFPIVAGDAASSYRLAALTQIYRGRGSPRLLRTLALSVRISVIDNRFARDATVFTTPHRVFHPCHATPQSAINTRPMPLPHANRTLNPPPPHHSKHVLSAHPSSDTSLPHPRGALNGL